MEKSDSPHIFHIPTISAGRDKKTYQSKCPSFLLVSNLCVCLCIHRPLLEPVESLLQMLLLWDPAMRGGGLDPDTNKPHYYTILQTILNMKVDTTPLLLFIFT